MSIGRRVPPLFSGSPDWPSPIKDRVGRGFTVPYVVLADRPRPLAVKTSSPTIDRLFRAERRPNVELDYPRAEAARILLTTSSHRGMQPDDRAYLVRLTAANTGLAQPDAERRVDEVAARAKENISRARRSAVILAFSTGAAALLGAAASWFAACAGGRIRDGEAAPHAIFDWGKPIGRT